MESFMYARAMALTHPNVDVGVVSSLIHCIEECEACAQVCSACADACIGETFERELVQCIRTALDCADLCRTAGMIATRRSGSNPTVIISALQACVEACARCAEACGHHAGRVQHCRICATRCGHCESACLEAIADLEEDSRDVAGVRH